jgi:hypothetical protein
MTALTLIYRHYALVFDDLLPLLPVYIVFNHILISQVCSTLVCRNICERIHSEKVVFGISNYSLGQKYCRRREVYMYNNSMFCPCCSMPLKHEVVEDVRKYSKKRDIYAKGLMVNGSIFNSKRRNQIMETL